MVTYNDVKDFYDAKIREGLRIDYKKDFPSELNRIAASFANTAGGIILLGIETDEANVPSQIVGVPLVKGLEERVLNICHSGIYPPITPDVKVCPYSSTDGSSPDKCLIMVRVHESAQAPHLIGKKRNLIYVRIDNESEQADPDAIRNLIEKQERGIQRSKEILGSRKLVSPFQPEIAGTPEFPNWLTTQVILLPSSITRSLTEFTQETDRFLGALPKGRMEFGDENPKQNGIEWHLEKNDFESFAEVTNDGLIQYKQKEKREDTVFFPRVVQLISDAVNFATAVYKEFGFVGSVTVSLVLEGTKNRHVLGEEWHNAHSNYISATGLVAVQKEINLDQLALEPITLI